ncbi:MAG: hypothetical protein ACYCOU_12430 [Sulfobacillus sp.]
MNSHVSHYLLEAITPWGIRTFYADLFSHAKAIIMLSGGSLADSSFLLREILQTLTTSTEVFHSAVHPELITALCIDQKLVIAHREIIAEAPNAVDAQSVIDVPISATLHPGDPLSHKLPARVPALLGMAKCAMDELEASLRPDIDMQAVTSARYHLLQFLSGSGQQGNGARHFWGATVSDAGWTNFLSNVLSSQKHRIRFEGPPGLNHTSLIRWFGERAMLSGYEVHLFHCEWDPTRVDHVVIPELSLGVTLSTAPHALPDLLGDDVIDMGQWRKHSFSVDPWEVLTVYRIAIARAEALLSNAPHIKEPQFTMQNLLSVLQSLVESLLHPAARAL